MDYKLVTICVIVVFILICMASKLKQINQEHMTSTSEFDTTAIHNIASIYNTDNLSVTNASITNLIKAKQLQVDGNTQTQNLEVKGDAHIKRLGVNTSQQFATFDVVASGGKYSNGESDPNNGIMVTTGYDKGDSCLYMGGDKANNLSYIQAVNIGQYGNSLLLNARGGAVGIGITTQPLSTLHVGGNITTTGNIVSTSRKDARWSKGALASDSKSLTYCFLNEDYNNMPSLFSRNDDQVNGTYFTSKINALYSISVVFNVHAGLTAWLEKNGDNTTNYIDRQNATNGDASNILMYQDTSTRDEHGFSWIGYLSISDKIRLKMSGRTNVNSPLVWSFTVNMISQVQ